MAVLTRRLILGPDMQPRVCCRVCGWGVLSPSFVYMDAWRGFRRRLSLAYRGRRTMPVLLCVWCAARGYE